MDVPLYRGHSKAVVEGGTSITIAKPNKTRVGDLLIATVGAGSSATITAPNSEWTLLNASGTLNFYLFWKIARTREPSSYTFSSSASVVLTGCIARIDHINKNAPIPRVVAALGASGNPACSNIAFTLDPYMVYRVMFELSSNVATSVGGSNSPIFLDTIGASTCHQAIAYHTNITGSAGIVTFSTPTSVVSWRAISIGIAPSRRLFAVNARPNNNRTSVEAIVSTGGINSIGLVRNEKVFSSGIFSNERFHDIQYYR